MSSDRKKLCLVVGPTGSGKSKQIKRYAKADSSAPKVGTDMQSETEKTVPYPCIVDGEEVVLFDTPGLGDSENRDQLFLTELVETLQNNWTGIHKFYFTMPVMETRFNQYIQICIGLLLQLAPDIKAKPSILTLVLTRADANHKDYWDSPDQPVSKKIAQLKDLMKQKFGVDIDIIVIGEGNQEQFKQSIKNASLDIFAKTEFMRHVETLDTERNKAYAELAAAKKENEQNQEKIGKLEEAYKAADQQIESIKQKAAADLEAAKKESTASQEKIQQLQQAFDTAEKSKNDNKAAMDAEIASLKTQLANTKTEVIHHYHDDGGSDCVII